MIIAVDMDEVCAKWMSRIVQWYNEDKEKEACRAGLPFTPYSENDVDQWEVKMNLGPDSEVYIRNYMRYPTFFSDLEPVEGAIEGMKELIDLGHDVIIATAVPKSATMGYVGKIDWLRKNMPFLDLDNVFTGKRKDLIDADILLDDGVHNLDPWHAKRERGIDTMAVAFDRPWNQTAKTPIRVRSWPEFITLVKKWDRKVTS